MRPMGTSTQGIVFKKKQHEHHRGVWGPTGLWPVLAFHFIENCLRKPSWANCLKLYLYLVLCISHCKFSCCTGWLILWCLCGAWE
jgi:hypothetical protein